MLAFSPGNCQQKSTSTSMASDSYLPALTEDKRQLFEHKFANGHDLTIDAKYNAWKTAKLQTVSPSESEPTSPTTVDSPDTDVVGITVSYDMG